MKKIIAILLLVVFVTATFALVVTSKQAKFTKVTPLFKRRVAWATKEKKAFSWIKVNYLMKNKIFVWSWLKFNPCLKLNVLPLQQDAFRPSCSHPTCSDTFTCFSKTCIPKC